MSFYSHLKKDYKAVVIGGSAGSIKVVKTLLQSIKIIPKMPIIIGLHRLQSDTNSTLREVLQYATALPIIEPIHGTPISDGHIYLAPVNQHLLVDKNHQFALSSSELVQYSRPSIDVLFTSASEFYQKKLVGILLTGANRDGAMGMKIIKQQGGLTIVQNPDEAFVSTMPQAAMAMTTIDYVLSQEQIAELILHLGS